MFITKLTLKRFRCFSEQTFIFDAPFVLIQGTNGSGKTSMLEALYYGCYLRSFRSSSSKDLIMQHELTPDNSSHLPPENEHHVSPSPYFFIEITFKAHDGDQHTIQIGVSDTQKVVTLDTQSVKSLKDIMGHYRVICLYEQDMQLVQGGPELRRGFLDTALTLNDDGYLAQMRRHKSVLEQRNSLLASLQTQPSLTSSAYQQLMLWSEQLWLEMSRIQEKRLLYLAALEKQANELLSTYFSADGLCIVSFIYSSKVPQTFSSFWQKHQEKGLSKEIMWRRSTYGAHLDDVQILFNGKPARMFASRGQQKLVVFVLKLSQVLLTLHQHGSCTLLLDDFLTDFDESRVAQCMALLKTLPLQGQIFITTPLTTALLEGWLGTQRISLG